MTEYKTYRERILEHIQRIPKEDMFYLAMFPPVPIAYIKRDRLKEELAKNKKIFEHNLRYILIG